MNNLEAGNDLYLRGDLNQMANQRQFISKNDIDLTQVDVYPVVGKSNVIQALSLIWLHSAPGWWHYKDEYIKYGICTNEDFKAKLKKQ